jgi:hypothetical protein
MQNCYPQDKLRFGLGATFGGEIVFVIVQEEKFGDVKRGQGY